MLACRRNFFPRNCRPFNDCHNTASGAVNELRSSLRNFFFDAVLYVPLRREFMQRVEHDGRQSDHSVCAASVASRNFLGGAATPPREEGITFHIHIHISTSSQHLRHLPMYPPI